MQEMVNQRERVSRKAWRLKHKQAIQWAALPEWRSRKDTSEWRKNEIPAKP